MTILILDRSDGPLPPYDRWLGEHGEDLVLFTARPADDGSGGYARVRSFPGYRTSTEVETASLELASAGTVTAVVATATGDLIRAGALRDHLRLPGPGRSATLALADPVVLRRGLTAKGFSTVPAGPVRRAVDFYRYAAVWGYPVHVRHRREPGWPAVATLDDESAVGAFTRDLFGADLGSMPSLMAEPQIDGALFTAHLSAGSSAADAADAADAGESSGERQRVARAVVAELGLPAGHPIVVRLRDGGTGWLVDTVSADASDEVRLRETVLAQAPVGERR